jgi:hypothetical protein
MEASARAGASFVADCRMRAPVARPMLSRICRHCYRTLREAARSTASLRVTRAGSLQMESLSLKRDVGLKRESCSTS